MTSFLSRMANEATAALTDAYGHVMHGDDAGSSAKVVWVVHPTRVPIDAAAAASASEGVNASADASQAGGSGKKKKGRGGAGDHDAAIVSPGRAGGPSYAYTQKFDLGLTFIEINDRAYVRTVEPNSVAEKAGIQPKDCVQFACVLGGPQFDDLQVDVQDGGGGGSNSRAGREHRRENERRLQLLEGRATKFALSCEGRGMRVSYGELRDLFAGCTLPPRAGAAGGDNADEPPKLITPPRNQPPTAASAKQGLKRNGTIDDDFTIGSNSLILASDSVGGMFESNRRYDANQVSSRRVPLPDRKVAKSVTLNVTNAARDAAGRCFADDAGTVDEATEDGSFYDGGARGRESKSKGGGSSSLPVLDTPASPIKNDVDNSNLLSSPRGGGADGSGMMAEDQQSLYPVVMIFRRTVQRKRMLGAGSSSKGGVWSSAGLSLGGSLFGIPSFRMDDECDRAAALIRQLAPASEGRRRGPDSTSGGMFCGDRSSDGDTSTLGGGKSTGGGPGDGNEDIEASTIRGMIGAAVGLGFVRLSKVVVGVSLQGGSGIIISRLPDGSWSAPSAMGVYGLGVGLQFGLEVADFIFIIQTPEGMEHFKRGGNFVVGGNIGAAVVNCGREAYGAASLGVCTGPMPLDTERESKKDDDESTYQSTNASTVNNHTRQHQHDKKKKDSDIAPMVAYAKSQGLYFGVSVDGLKFFTRNDINARTYKFSMLSEMPAKDILSGMVLPPPEAEDLYSALHSVEYTHEMTELPQPPDMLRRDSMNDWRFDRSIAAVKGEIIDSNDGGSRKSSKRQLPIYSFLSTLNREEADQFAQFETKFKKFLYGGVSVQHLLPNLSPTRSGLTRREKRTLWLMLPEVGSLRLGFVSKVKPGSDGSVMDDISAASSVASSRAEVEFDSGNIRLSNKYSISLTDITALSQDPNVTIRLSPDDATEHLRVLSINDVTGKSMLFLASSKREAELLFCGLKLLLECESARLSVRGGVPLNKLGGRLGKGALSPVLARGSLKSSRGSGRRDRQDLSRNHNIPRRGKEDLDDRSKYSSFGEPGTSSDESVTNDETQAEESDIARLGDRFQVPEGRQSWSQLPGRNKMRQMASGVSAPISPKSQQLPTYELGKAIYTDIATNISLPLPLQLCRVMFLDSSSLVNKSWENYRTDSDYRHGAWAFPPGSVREFEKNNSSEHQLISRGSMLGAQRNISYSRTRNRELVRLSETIVVEQDDDQSLVFVIIDQMPRRGFSAKARLHLRSFGNRSCEARVVTEIRPVGKNLSDQQAVHKAFLLVLDEMKKRYGVEEKGLLSVFLDVYQTGPGSNNAASPKMSQASSRSPSNQTQSSITSFKDVLPSGNGVDHSTAPRPLPGSRFSNSTPQTPVPVSQTPPRSAQQQSQSKERPSTPSMRKIDSKSVGIPSRAQHQDVASDDFADFSNFDDIPRNPVTVEVKPLPKIRLDLCPVPREEDEEEDSSVSVADAKQKRKSKNSKQKQKSRRSSRNR